MKDAYGDGSVIRGLVNGVGLFYGFLGLLYAVYCVAVWIKS